MKIRNISFLLAAAVLAFGSCKEDTIVPVQTPAVDSSSITPAANESGSTRAYAGTEVSVTGFNLDKVGRVTVEDVDAEIISQDIQTLTFAVPELPAETFPQRDNPYPVTLRVYDSDCETVVFNYPYYVTVPVTDAIFESFSPATGTVGDMITIEGRNLDQITKVVFNGVEVGNSSFGEESSEDAILVPVPGGIETSGASTSVTITAEWGGSKVLDITSETSTFSLLVPVFDAYTQDGTIVLASEITLTGENLNLCAGLRWGETELIISSVAEDGKSMTVKFPNKIDGATSSDETAALTAYYGTPEQTVTIAENVTVNTTPVGAPEPVFESVVPADDSYKNLYLGNKAKITGSNMSTVEKVIIDGKEAADVVVNGDTEVIFTVPETIEGTAGPVTVSLSAEYDGGNPVTFSDNVSVYPFYYVKGLQLGVGASSKTTDFGYSNSFLMLNDRKVISADEWNTSDADPFFKSSENTSSKNKVTVSEDEYYSVEPYTFITASTDGALSFQSPSNSDSQIRSFFRNNEELYIKVYGTPMLYFRVVSDNDELKQSAIDGTLADVVYDKVCSSSAPKLATAESSSAWVEGSVIAVEYINYAQASTGKPDDLEDVYRCGYIVVTDVTAADLGTGNAHEDRSGYVEFDLYWSNPLN